MVLLARLPAHLDGRSFTIRRRSFMARIAPVLPLFCLTAGFFIASTARADAPAAQEFFENEVRPLLVEHCQKCHSDNKPKGGLRLTSRDAVLKGGDSGPAAVPGK